MKITETMFAGVKILKPTRLSDNRGFFAEIYNRRVFEDLGIDVDFVQENHSLSSEVGTVRGLHFQSPPHAQTKLVRCGRGAIFDVVVDIRQGSPTYGLWIGQELSAKNGTQLFISAGFAHGFVTLEPDSEIIYMCSNYYAPEAEVALRWDDPELNIYWPIKGNAILSEKDISAPVLADLDSTFVWKDKL
ncbi:dTDP-4-dehydrorhamnose 3,5-epimerase [Amylibacter sp.]|nr:dTDP-4-dehydrorhamnose 3,5-epimerase [Amylibacter sp.]